jgi:hypothetical protein
MPQTRQTPGAGQAPGGSSKVIATTVAIVNLILPPAGKRRMAVAVVRCPFCRRPHLHRGYRLPGAMRRPSCSGRRQYVLEVAA